MIYRKLKGMVTIFGLVRKSKILKMIKAEKHESINKMDKHVCNGIGYTEQDRINHIYEFSNMQGGIDALIKLYNLIK